MGRTELALNGSWKPERISHPSLTLTRPSKQLTSKYPFRFSTLNCVPNTVTVPSAVVTWNFSPFATLKKEKSKSLPDSLFYVRFDKNGLANFSCNRSGFYFLQPNEKIQEGFTISLFTDRYPKMASYTAMLLPLRYITTSKEYRDMKAQDNHKKAIDDYWLGVSGSIPSAKALIKEYYKATNLFI